MISVRDDSLSNLATTSRDEDSNHVAKAFCLCGRHASGGGPGSKVITLRGPVVELAVFGRLSFEPPCLARGTICRRCGKLRAFLPSPARGAWPARRVAGDARAPVVH